MKESRSAQRHGLVRLGPTASLAYLARILVLSAVVAGSLLYLDGGGSLPLIGQLKPGAGDEAGGEFVALDGGHTGAGGQAPQAGQAAPGFSLTNLAGQAVNLSDFRDGFVILSFWASWCPACRDDFPELQRLFEDLQHQGLAVIAINFEESTATANVFANETGVAFPVLLDRDGSVAARYRVSGLPVTYIIAPGSILKSQVFGPLRADDLARELAQAGFVGAE